MFRSLRTAAFIVINSMILIETKQHELRFVNVVFRHGDRTPDDNGKELYPTDPYLNYDFYPMGLGALTNNGKRREYTLGLVLRERYGHFLGNVYIPEDIVARSTDYGRTKMSLLLVLAGLYPPAPVQRWNPALYWQPIPTTYLPDALDVLLVPEECPRYLEELDRVKSLPKVVRMVDEFRPLMNYLTNKTGRPIVDTTDMWYLYHNFVAESSMGLVLPEWTENIFPDGALLDAAILEYNIVSYNDLLKKLNGGTLLKRMSDDMIAIVKSQPTEGRKINLFGGHETNIAALLHTLGVYKPHVPEYSSAVILELITNGYEHYVRVLYYRGIPSKIEELTIPGCEVLCPFENFLKLLENVTPTDQDLVCQKNVSATAGLHTNSLGHLCLKIELSNYLFFLVLHKDADEFIEKLIPDCASILCPLETLKNIFAKVIPPNGSLECGTLQFLRLPHYFRSGHLCLLFHDIRSFSFADGTMK